MAEPGAIELHWDDLSELWDGRAPVPSTAPSNVARCGPAGIARFGVRGASAAFCAMTGRLDSLQVSVPLTDPARALLLALGARDYEVSALAEPELPSVRVSVTDPATHEALVRVAALGLGLPASLISVPAVRFLASAERAALLAVVAGDHPGLIETEAEDALAAAVEAGRNLVLDDLAPITDAEGRVRLAAATAEIASTLRGRRGAGSVARALEQLLTAASRGVGPNKRGFEPRKKGLPAMAEEYDVPRGFRAVEPDERMPDGSAPHPAATSVTNGGFELPELTTHGYRGSRLGRLDVGPHSWVTATVDLWQDLPDTDPLWLVCFGPDGDAIVGGAPLLSFHDTLECRFPSVELISWVRVDRRPGTVGTVSRHLAAARAGWLAELLRRRAATPAAAGAAFAEVCLEWFGLRDLRLAGWASLLADQQPIGHGLAGDVVGRSLLRLTAPHAGMLRGLAWLPAWVYLADPASLVELSW